MILSLSLVPNFVQLLSRARRCRGVGKSALLLLRLLLLLPSVVLGKWRVCRVTVPTPPWRFALLVESGIQTGRMIALVTTRALYQIVLRLLLQFTTGAQLRAVVARPGDAPLDEKRKLRRRTGVVQRGAAYGASTQLLHVAALRRGRRVVVDGTRRGQALLANRQRRR